MSVSASLEFLFTQLIYTEGPKVLVETMKTKPCCINLVLFSRPFRLTIKYRGNQFNSDYIDLYQIDLNEF